PTISLVPVPDAQLQGSTVTVLADLTDDSGINSATLHYRTEGAANFDTVAMSVRAGTTWGADIPGAAVQTPAVQYYVSATDASPNANTATAPAGGAANPARFTVTASDTSGPTIAHTPPPGPWTAGDSLFITALISDGSGVGAAQIQWRTQGTDGPFTQAALSDNGDGTWSATVGPVQAPGVEYYLTASDTLDNATTEPTDAPGTVFSVTVVTPDTAGPTIVHTPIEDAQEPGLPVTVTATITDESPIASALVRYRIIGSATFGEALMTNPNGDTWTATIPGVVVNAPGVEYIIDATDASPNANMSSLPENGLFSFTVGLETFDQEPPTIEHDPIVGIQPEGMAVSIEATITDMSGVAQAGLFFRPAGDENWLSTGMVNTNGDQWVATIPSFIVNAPGVDYYIEAVDASDNANTGTDPDGAPDIVYAFDVMVPDMEGPAIDLDPIDSPQVEGTPLPVSAMVVDPSGVQYAELMVLAPGSDTWEVLSMDPAGADRYATVIPAEFVLPGQLRYYVEAGDMLNNTAEAPIGGRPAALAVTIEPEPEEDIIGPTILHSPPATALFGEPLTLQALITDVSGVDTANLLFRPAGEENWTTLAMEEEQPNRWSATLPSEVTQAMAIEYTLEATDEEGNTSIDPEDAPEQFYSVQVLGDGDDTGMIDPDTGMIDPDTGMVDPDTGMVDPDTDMVDPDTGMIDPDTDMVDPDTGMVDPDTDMVDPDTDMVDPDTDMGDTGVEPDTVDDTDNVVPDTGGSTTDTDLGIDSGNDGVDTTAGDDGGCGCTLHASRRPLPLGWVAIVGVLGLAVLGRRQR
ncbi:MAG: hypothetical protein AAFS10_07030, partial [Myxococcota bacterium]